jgi:hypothetical protein
MTYKKKDYYTTLSKAKDVVPGFREAFSRFEECLVLDQCYKSMFTNYSRNLAHLALHFGRYTHKIAITKHRILSVSKTDVSFRYKDYADGDKQKVMHLSREEFLRRFELHFLPSHFIKIRHYGFLASRVKQKLKIEQMKQGILPHKEKQSNLNYKEITKNQLGFDIDQCPCCKIGRMITVLQFGANAVLVNMPNPPPITIQYNRKTMKVN